MKITKKIIIDAPREKIWKVFAHDFNDAGKWMSSIPKSYAEDLGEKFEGAHSKGRVCELGNDLKSMKASEKFLAYDEANHTCTVEIKFVNAPTLLPIKGNVLNFALKEKAPGRTLVHWEVTPMMKARVKFLFPLVKVGLGVFLIQILEELKHFVEHGTPHPRKIKAIKRQARGE